MREALGSLARICYGKSPAQVLNVEGEVPVVGTGGVYARAGRALFKSGVVVARKGSLGTPHLMRHPYWPSDTTFAVLPNDGVHLEWLYFNLLNFDLTKLNEATGVPSISRDWLAKVTFLRPTAAQQQRIAAILNSLDAAIEATEALIEKHQQTRVGLMRDMFTRGLGEDGRLRTAAKATLTKFGFLPAGWRLGSILELTDPSRQAILTGPFGADLGAGDFVDEGVPVLRIGNVQAGRVDTADLLYVSPKKAAALSRYLVEEGDLLFARQGATTGRNALAGGSVGGSLINYHIIRVALDQDRCAPLFVEAAFASEIVARQIERDKGRGTREGINTAQITSLAFPIAEVCEQRRIAEALARQNRRIDADVAVLAKLRMQKQGLMQDLLTGRVAMHLPTPEPALT